MNDFTYYFIYILFLIGVSTVFTPIVTKFTNYKSTVNWIVGKAIGLLVITYVTWIINHFLFFNYAITLSLLITSGLFYLSIKRQNKPFNFYLINYKKIVLLEVMFILSSFTYLLYRYINPQVEGIEKFMDQALLQSLTKTPTMPPIDIWFSQSSLKYYYFGQYIFALTAKLLNIPFYLNYNISISILFGLTFSISACFLYLLTKNKIISVLGTIFVLLGGNLDFLYKSLILKSNNYFFAEARALIDYSITEFPAYSYILGDLHAHIINLPFVILYLIILLIIYNSKKLGFPTVILGGFILGILFMINSWDFLIYSLLTLIIFVIKYYKNFDRKNSLILIMYFSIALITLMPFKINFAAAVWGIGINTKFSPPLAIFLMFFHLLIGVLILVTIKKFAKIKNKQLNFGLILALFGILIILLAEVFFIKDIYFSANPPYYRANTVFKLWYQAYLILGFVFVYGIYIVTTIKKKLGYLVILILIPLIYYSLVYTYNAVLYYYKNSNKDNYGLNGLNFMNNVGLNNEKEAIYFLNKNIKGQVVILEKPGDSYTTDNLFSVFTGNPATVGWINHEFGWQGKWDPIAKTLTDVEKMYTSNNVEEVKNLLKKYNIKYVIVGQKEKVKYGENAGETIKLIGKEFYKNQELSVISIN